VVDLSLQSLFFPGAYLNWLIDLGKFQLSFQTFQFCSTVMSQFISERNKRFSQLRSQLLACVRFPLTHPTI
jgi:hypothetical protein